MYAVDYLKQLGTSDRLSAPLGQGIVIIIITYLSEIIGELVPKNVALRNAEAIACLVAPLMTGFRRYD